MKRAYFLPGLLTTVAIALGAATNQHGMVRGYLAKDGHVVFPIGIYEMPKTDAELQCMAKAGINLVRCRNKEDLDRAKAAGMMGWVPLDLQSADPRKVQQVVDSVKNHPALAAWEGPDEFVWNFTGGPSLYREGIYKVPREWWLQTPVAVEHSEAEARTLMPRLTGNIRLLRSLDGGRHPLWMNEAAKSDLKLVREYIEHVDITGSDMYPVRGGERQPSVIGDYTDRFLAIGKGRPVWMVLQGFAWRNLNIPSDTEKLEYPSFSETRLMAYSAVAHGARGILYWGTPWIPADSGAAFRDSIYAMASELAKLQPFLTAREETGIGIALTESTGRPELSDRGVRWLARRAGSDWLIVLANEDNHPHMGVEVRGLESLNGLRLELLYGSETAIVGEGEFITRLMPQEVKLFATSRKWESSWKEGRGFTDQPSGIEARRKNTSGTPLPDEQ